MKFIKYRKVNKLTYVEYFIWLVYHTYIDNVIHTISPHIFPSISTEFERLDYQPTPQLFQVLTIFVRKIVFVLNGYMEIILLR